MKSNLFTEGKIGIVLSGGGAKGAYQAGVFRALSSLGLLSRIHVVSGCSIGALNAMLYATGDAKQCDAAWDDVSYAQFICTDDQSKLPRVKNLIHELAHKTPEIPAYEILRRYDLGVLSQRNLRQLVLTYGGFDALAHMDTYYYACCYNTRDYRPDYFCLNGCDHDRVLDIVLASAAIPFLYRPVMIDGIPYADGGINSPSYPASNADKIPVAPLSSHACDLVIIVYLTQSDKADISMLPEGTHVLELYPSKPLEVVRGSGTLDLTPSALMERRTLGERDTLCALAPLLSGALREENFALSLDEHAKANFNLLHS